MKLLGDIAVMHTVKHKGGKITEDLDIIQNILDIVTYTDIDVLKKQLKISLIIGKHWEIFITLLLSFLCSLLKIKVKTY